MGTIELFEYRKMRVLWWKMGKTGRGYVDVEGVLNFDVEDASSLGLHVPRALFR